MDYTALGKMTADMVVQVLVDGKSPATLPVATFDNGIEADEQRQTARLIVYRPVFEMMPARMLSTPRRAVKQAFDGKCSSVLETTTQQNFD